MAFQVTTFCTYRTRRTPPWSDAGPAASKFIKALKERPVSGWASVPVGKEYVRLDAANAREAADIFARQVACSLEGNCLDESMFIPLPNSSCTLKSSDPPRILKMATALVRRLNTVNAIIADVLRWRQPCRRLTQLMERVTRRYSSRGFAIASPYPLIVVSC